MVTFSVLLTGLFGLLLLGGGIYLVVFGGSVYYVLAGGGMLISALLLHRRSAHALTVYAAVLFGTLVWALWEVGFDWWQLGPRGGLPVLLGLWLLMPFVRLRLERAPLSPAIGGVPSLALVAACFLSAGVAGWSMFVDPHDVAGRLPEDTRQTAVDQRGVPDGEWWQYGRTPLGQRYSPLTQITVDNVDSLKEAWRYQTGDVKRPEDVGETTYQVTPLKIDDTLYLCTPHNWAIAIDAATGKEKWKFDPQAGLNPNRQHQTCRGVTYFRDVAATAGTPCAERVYLPTSDARLIALDARDGSVCTTFADQGALHLEAGMKHTPEGYYYSTSPPVVAGRKIIIGGAVNDNYSTEEQSGVIRAFDVDTGALIWNWDSGNPTETAPLPPGQTYTTNSPNSWSVFSVDRGVAGLVYIPLSATRCPTSSAWGRSAKRWRSTRPRWSALDIVTGQRALGVARRCTTISGTWTYRLSRCWSTSPGPTEPVGAGAGRPDQAGRSLRAQTRETGANRSCR